MLTMQFKSVVLVCALLVMVVLPTVVVETRSSPQTYAPCKKCYVYLNGK